ncbi:MAG: response regulator [Clostridiales bacterium]|nr:response regulator [Clostridiales bacterium]
MYKVMIADDEWIVQEGIKVSLQNHFSNIEIVGMASTGREAIEMNAEKHPDIILMDIKMPGINGIEAIETIRKRYHQTRFVIISAYEQFEYAKQAVELGVCDYILKPINQAKLIQVIKRAMDDIDEEREQRSRMIKNREKLEQVMPVLEKGFIYSLLMNTDFKRELIKYQDIFEIKKEKAYVFVLELFHKDEDRLSTEIKNDLLYPKIQNTIKYKCHCAIGPMIINRITVVVFEDHYDFEYEQRVKAMALAETIIETINDSDISLKIGIGSCYSLEKTRNSLEEANYALTKINLENVLHHNDIFEQDIENNYTYTEIKDDEIEIIHLMETGQKEALQESTNAFFEKLRTKFSHDTIDSRNIILELMVMVLSTSYRNNLNESEVGYSSYLNEIKRFDQINQLENWCIRKISSISDKIQNKKNSHVSNVIIKARSFIDENYAKDIGLNDVSKEVSISPQYFSTIFKEEMGLNFVEYLRNKRVEVAKELLRSKEYTVKEICYQIGYNDPNYFSRLFKKLVGVSPTEFK